ncbi:hypothetical protein GGR56DRAFT_196806 [Xylariaceae sp. FL0804]|nr:hypothetical protein GGR56DRAFT_196806 [Xylariaceae sp. FL0804]
MTRSPSQKLSGSRFAVSLPPGLPPPRSLFLPTRKHAYSHRPRGRRGWLTPLCVPEQPESRCRVEITVPDPREEGPPGPGAHDVRLRRSHGPAAGGRAACRCPPTYGYGMDLSRPRTTMTTTTTTRDHRADDYYSAHDLDGQDHEGVDDVWEGDFAEPDVEQLPVLPNAFRRPSSSSSRSSFSSTGLWRSLGDRGGDGGREDPLDPRHAPRHRHHHQYHRRHPGLQHQHQRQQEQQQQQQQQQAVALQRWQTALYALAVVREAHGMALPEQGYFEVPIHFGGGGAGARPSGTTKTTTTTTMLPRSWAVGVPRVM